MADVRAIDADALLKQNPFTKIGGCLSEYNEGFLDCAEEAREAVKNAPTINPDCLRPHGWWVDIYRLEVKPEWVCRCSLCGCPQDFKHHYCPNCGAKMDGKERCK